MSNFDPNAFDDLIAVEDTHFWFRARNRLLARLFKRVRLPAGAASRPLVLEIGCGTGNVLRFLRRGFPDAFVLGIDRFPEGLRFARRRLGRGLVAADIGAPPFRANADAVCMFDVLEHIEDDVDVLQKTFRLLKPGGVLMITVPLHRWLWSDFDDHSQHVRRYAFDELATKIRSAGFAVEFASPFFGLLVPLMWLSRSVRSGGGASNFRIVPGVNAILHLLLRIDSAIVGRARRVPFGSSMVVVARKTDEGRNG